MLAATLITERVIDSHTEVRPDEFNLVRDSFLFGVHVCTIDLVLGDCDACNVDLEGSDDSRSILEGSPHIGPSCIFTSWLTDTTTSV